MRGPFASDASAAASAAAVAAAATATKAAAAAAGAAAATTAAATTAAAAAPRISRGPPLLRLYLTGFGPFGEIKENPSGVLVEALAAALDDSECISQSAVSLEETAAASSQGPPANHRGGPPLQHLSCLELCGSEVLEVSAEAAEEAATRIHRLLRRGPYHATRGPLSSATEGPSLPQEGPPSSPENEAPSRGTGDLFLVEGAPPFSAAGGLQGVAAAAGAATRLKAEALMPGGSEEEEACGEEAPKPLCLAIHFGVNAKSSVWMLEKAAKNDARFPCKDTKGCVPGSREICCSLPFEARLRCGLPLESVPDVCLYLSSAASLHLLLWLMLGVMKERATAIDTVDVAAALRQRGHPCSTSEDAGQELCCCLLLPAAAAAAAAADEVSWAAARRSPSTRSPVTVSDWLGAAASKAFKRRGAAGPRPSASRRLKEREQQQTLDCNSSKLLSFSSSSSSKPCGAASSGLELLFCCLSLLPHSLLLAISLPVSPLPQVPPFSLPASAILLNLAAAAAAAAATAAAAAYICV
ncbi:hypothetical protein Emag_007359 [Eimeria magna]